ncbi:MAG: tail fiber domain-containing protein [Desulfomonile tiedjei]|nr:tail fiber domain-containing protein [Desulfomonile tiedjei]
MRYATIGAVAGILLLALVVTLWAGDFFVVTDTGNVGIGTTAPDFKFDVRQSANSPAGQFRVDGSGIQTVLQIVNRNTGSGAANEGSELTFVGGSGSGAGPNLASIAAAWNGAATTDSYLRFSTRGSSSLTEALRITSAGNVGIGTASPASRLDVSGGCITGSMCSDARLKKNIRSLPKEESYLKKVLRLRGVSFEWKGYTSMGRQIGLLAQEVERVVPEAVTTPEGDITQKGLSCTAIDAVLIEAIKEQQEAILELQKEVVTLKRGQ